MGWQHRYAFDGSRIDAERVSDASRRVAAELGGRAEVQSLEGDDLEVYFVVPLANLRARESSVFDHELATEALDHAGALTLLAVFRRHPTRREVQLSVEADDVANALCVRTAAHIAQRLVAILSGPAMGGW